MKSVFLLAFSLIASMAHAQTPWADIDSSKFSALPWQIQNVIDEDRSYFFLLSFPPKVGLDFRTAEKLKSSLAVSGWGKSDIGHNMVVWSCKGTNGKWHRAATGFTGENSEQSKEMIKNGWGLTTFVSVFTDGFLTATNEAEAVIAKKQKESPMRYVGIEITPKQCDAVVSFVKKFAQSKGATQFGLSGDINKMEGGGCGSFAAAVTDKLGVFNKLSPYLWKKFSIPNRLLGKRTDIPLDTRIPVPILTSKVEEKKVSFQLLLNSTWMMTPKDNSTFSLTIVDPIMIVYMLKEIQEVNYSLLDSRYVDVLKKQNKITVKRSEEDMHSDHGNQKKVVTEKVTAKFDYRTEGMSPLARSLGTSLVKQGFYPRAEYVDTSLGLIFER